MGIVRMGVPEKLVLFLQRSFGLDLFIETGTFKGDTASWAADHFKRVITIELSDELFAETTVRYRHRDNIHFIRGDSPEELGKIMKQIAAPALIWLDAHHCSLNTAGKGSPAAILHEIDAIGSSAYEHFILIDDARLFLAPPPDPHPLDEYPDIATLIKRLNLHKKNHVLVYDDVIVCVPESAKETVAAFCKKEITRSDKAFWAGKASAPRTDGQRFIPLLKAAARKTLDMIRRKRSARRRWNKYQADFRSFAGLAKKEGRFPCRWEDRYPCLDDATANTPVDRHYVLHPVWALRILLQNKPELHVDIASTLRFVAQLSCLMPVKHYDYRPPLLRIAGLECGQADLTQLSFADDSIGSLSCMHTVEHIGLGRYGDPLDSDGDIKAAGELARVLAPGGSLLFVVPVGHSRIAFNAHRIYSYQQVLDLFPSLRLKQYALIPDSHESGDILDGASPQLTDSQNHGCGCFWFTKGEGK